MATSTTLSLFILTAAFSLLSSSAPSVTTSPTATLLFLNCTPPSLQSTLTRPSLTRLLDRIINQAQPAHFAVSSIVMNQTNVTGLIQCQFDLDTARCNRCARFAKRTVLTLCPNSESVAAWFDGCYVEASMAGFTLRPTLTRFCSGTRPVHWVGFEPALNVLLVRLRIVPVGVHGDQFSYGKTTSSGGQTIHGHIECVRTLSVSECRSCVEKALENLHRSCGGSSRGYAVVGNRCLAAFEALGYMSSSVLDSARQGGKGNRGRRVVVVCWGIVVACLGGFVWTVWLVQRSIVNGAKVAALTTTTQDSDK